MNFEKLYSPEAEPLVIIKKSTEAPLDVRDNPFYDPEIWGRAISPDDIYLPDSDEAISFAIAAHEIGHLLERGKVNNTGLDNFEATRAEEKRAWEVGWPYIEKYLDDYYRDGENRSTEVRASFEKIKKLLMEATDLGEAMYLGKDELDELSNMDGESILKHKREEFFKKKGQEFKDIFSQVKSHKIGLKPDWTKFIKIVERALRDIIADNRANNNNFNS